MNLQQTLRSGLFLAGVTITLISSTSTASAHMGVATSNPGNGSQMVVAPEEATLTFNMTVDLNSAEAQLRHVGGPETSISEANRRDVKTDTLTKTSGEGPGTTVTFDLPSLPAGLYALDWSVREVDGHGNNSTLIFKVTDGVNDSSNVNLPVLLTGGFLAIVLGVVAAVVVRKRKQ
jgi:methionine-rich copper-binding protein CopC